MKIPDFSNWDIYESGIEFTTKDAGRIDIFSRNKSSNEIRVIELKKDPGDPNHIGQLLGYMVWVRSVLAGRNDVSGLPIAFDCNNRIKFALDDISTIDLFQYNLNFTLSRFNFD